jgi:hypothetical protein
VLTSCEVRKPSKKWTNGTRVRSVAAWAIERHVVGLLHRAPRPAGRTPVPHRHHVGMVAEDRQPLRGQRAGRDMEHRRGQFTGDLVHVGSISIRPCEAVKVVVSAPACRAPCIAPAAPPSLCISTTVGTLPQRLVLPVAGPLVGQLGHGRGRRDRVDRADLVEAVGDVAAASLPSMVTRMGSWHRAPLRDHLDGVAGALLVAGTAAGAPVVVDLVAQPGPSLMMACSGQAP